MAVRADFLVRLLRQTLNFGFRYARNLHLHFDGDAEAAALARANGRAAGDGRT